MNQLYFNIKTFLSINLEIFYKNIFYKLVFSRYFIFRIFLLRAKYDLQSFLPLWAKKPVKIKKFTVLRSPHVHKKSREQFEFRLHKSHLKILDFFNFSYHFSQFSGHYYMNLLLPFKDCKAQCKIFDFYVLLRS
jgi:hypothetical protein